MPYVAVRSTGAGTVNVRVTCGTDTSTATFTFAAAPGTEAPDITSFPDREGVAGDRLESFYTGVNVATANCTSARTGGTADSSGVTVRDLSNFGVVSGRMPYVAVTSTGAGTVNVTLTCGTDTSDATFTFAPAATPDPTTIVPTTIMRSAEAGNSIEVWLSVTPFTECAAPTRVSGLSVTPGVASHSIDNGPGRGTSTFQVVSAVSAAEGTLVWQIVCGGTTRQGTFEWTAATTVTIHGLPDAVRTVGTEILSAFSTVPATAASDCTVGATSGYTPPAGKTRVAATPRIDARPSGPVVTFFVASQWHSAGVAAFTLTCGTVTENVVFEWTVTGTTTAPVIDGFDPQRVTLRDGVTVVTASFTTTPPVDCDVSAVSWTDSDGFVTRSPASSAVTGVTWQVRDFSGGFNYVTAVEIRNQGAAGSLSLTLSCADTDETSAFRFDHPPHTIRSGNTPTGRPGQELLLGFSTTPVSDAVSCTVETLTMADQPGLPSLHGDVTPQVQVLRDPNGRVLFTAVAASSSTVGFLAVRLHCGAPRGVSYNHQSSFWWRLDGSSTSVISGFNDQQGAPSRRLETLFTTDPRELANECTVAVATQDNNGNTVGLIDADGNAITSAVVTVHHPFPIYLGTGRYVWHGAGMTSDTAGRATLRLSCNGDTADAVFTWTDDPDEVGTSAIIGLRSTHAGVLDLTGDPNNTLWLYDQFTVSPPGAPCTVTSGTTLYTVRLLDDDDVIEPFVAEQIDDDAEPDAAGERLLVVAFSAHLEAELTVTCSGGATQTVRWGARHTGTDTSTGLTIGTVEITMDPPTCVTRAEPGGTSATSPDCEGSFERGTSEPFGSLLMEASFNVSPPEARCGVTNPDNFDHTNPGVVGTTDPLTAVDLAQPNPENGHFSLYVLFTRYVTTDFILYCNYSDPALGRYADAQVRINWRAVPAGVACTARTPTGCDPPPAPDCPAGDTQTISDGPLTLSGLTCVFDMFVGVTDYTYYTVTPADTQCNWSVLDTAATREWSIPENLSVAYTTASSGSDRHIRMRASAAGNWNVQGICLATVIDADGYPDRTEFTVNRRVRARATVQSDASYCPEADYDEFATYRLGGIQISGSCHIPSAEWDGFGDTVDALRFKTGHDRRLDLIDFLAVVGRCWLPSEQELQRYIDAQDHYRGLLLQYGFAMSDFLSPRFQERFRQLTDEGRLQIRAAYDHLLEAQRRYFDTVGGPDGDESWYDGIPVVRGVLQFGTEVTSSIGALIRYITRLPESVLCTAWRVIVPDADLVVLVFYEGLGGGRGDGCRDDTNGPIEACDEGTLLTWPIEAVATAASRHSTPGNEDPRDCQGPRIVISRALYEVTDIGQSSAAGSVGDLTGLDTDDLETLDGYWFSTCDNLHGDCIDNPDTESIDECPDGGLDGVTGGSQFSGVWERLWSFIAFAAAMNALLLLICGLVLYWQARKFWRALNPKVTGEYESRPGTDIEPY